MRRRVNRRFGISDRDPMHQPVSLGEVSQPPVHGAPVVPDDDIAGAPLVFPYITGLRRVRPKGVEQFFAFVHGQAGNVGFQPAADAQGAHDGRNSGLAAQPHPA